MSKNNESRNLFNHFVKETGMYRVDNRNVFLRCGKKWVFSLSNTNKTVRQFYEDCVGIYIHEENRYIPKTLLKLGGITRISPTGIKAYNASYV